MKIFKHLKTVYKHRKEVRKLCFKCGIYWQGLVHDLSKYSPTEFIPSVKYWTGTCSPTEEEIKDKGYSEAWLHHQGRNKHHYQYWQDPTHNLIAPMPKKYVAEMFCDRVAACKIYQGKNYTRSSPYEYFAKNAKKEEFHPDTYTMLKVLLQLLKTHGELATCRYIKQLLRGKENE